MPPDFNKVVGKYLIVNQHCEPRFYVKNKPQLATFDQLDAQWWAAAQPYISETPRIMWGRSTWLVQPDRTLSFAGADYDTSD